MSFEFQSVSERHTVSQPRPVDFAACSLWPTDRPTGNTWPPIRARWARDVIWSSRAYKMFLWPPGRVLKKQVQEARSKRTIEDIQTKNCSSKMYKSPLVSNIVVWYANSSLQLGTGKTAGWLVGWLVVSRVCPFSKCFFSESFCPIELIFNTMVPYLGKIIDPHG